MAVPPGDFLLGDTSGHLLVLGASGKLVRRIPGDVGVYGPQGVEVAPDRRHAFVSILVSDRAPRLYEVDLETGRKRWLANAVSPSLSPDRTRLAYVTIALRADIVDSVALVVRDLRTRRGRSIPFAAHVVLGTGAESVVNWSPDGKHIAVFDGHRIRLVDVSTARNVWSQPAVPGVPPATPGRGTLLAPVYLDDGTLVALADCCIGVQHLVAVDLASGARTPFATLSAPVERIRRLRPALLMTVTARDNLVLVSRGRSRVIARDVTAAAA